MTKHRVILIHHTTWVNWLSTLVKRSPPGLPKVRTSQTPLVEKVAMQTQEEMLQAEIEFWLHMIKSRRGTISDQAAERMLKACELAERKLLMMMNLGSSQNETRQ